MIKIAVFDLDNTIISIDSFASFIFYVIRKHPYKIVHFPYIFYKSVLKLLGLIGFNEFKSSWMIIINNMTHEYLENISHDFVNEKLIQKIKPGAAEEIESLRKKGYKLILATASFEFYAGYLSEYLKFDYLFGTKIVYEDNAVKAEIDGINCKGEEKIKRIVNVINKNEIMISESIGYSDCMSDRFFLQITGAFNLVSKKKWRILKTINNNPE
jgi:phosphatidylglycerophosphatase C